MKNRVHLDLRPREGSRDDELARLLAHGATAVDDRRNPDGTGWAVLADPRATSSAPCAARPRSPRPVRRGRLTGGRCPDPTQLWRRASRARASGPDRVSRYASSVKGIAHHWSLRSGGQYEKDVLWTCPEPFHDAEAVCGLLCFYDDRVHVEVEGAV